MRINNTHIPLQLMVVGKVEMTLLKSVIVNKTQIQKSAFKISKFLRGKKQSSGQKILPKFNQLSFCVSDWSIHPSVVAKLLNITDTTLHGNTILILVFSYM